MRVTPLLCWSCQSWFIPKTKRKTKFCCNACRQQNYLQKKTNGLVSLYWEDEEDQKALSECLKYHCKDNQDNCVECLFENNYDLYCDEVYRRGRDRFGMSASEFLFQNNIL